MTKAVVFFVGLGIFSAAAACGNSPPPESPPGTTHRAGGAPAADADAGPRAPTAEELAASKKAFVADCSKDQPGTETYCGCAWDLARATYGDEAVRAKGTPSNDDLAKIHVKIAQSCSQHFPPEAIHRAFMQGCSRKERDLEAYCACTWNELTGRMQPGELFEERAKKSERYSAAVRSAANACGKLRPATR